MENIKLENSNLKVIKTLESDEEEYFYTIDAANDNEVVILWLNQETKKYEKVDEREYAILMNKFALIK